MTKNDKILEIPMNGVMFSHAVVQGSLRLNVEGLTLLSGDNGVGKTTLIEYLKYHQKEFFNDRVFFIDQSSLHLPDVLSGDDLLELLSASLGERYSLEKVQALMSVLEMEPVFLKTRIKDLSGGENQLLKIITSLGVIADFYILDEPFNHLDRGRRDKLRAYLRSSNLGYLVVDHFHTEWGSPTPYQIKLLKNDKTLTFEVLS